MSENRENTSQVTISGQIENQIAEGRRLLDLEISNPRELQRAAARRSIWVENNVKLLKDCPLADNLKSKLLPQASLDDTRTGEDFNAELHSFRDITKAQITVLESVLAIVPKMPEPGRVLRNEVEGEVSTVASINCPPAESNISFKERLERHPLGVAATLCLGCITLVLLVMSWYHDVSEKDLSYKYETQITGMKNEFDAQRRSYEETIRRLNDELAKARTHGNK